MIAVKTHVKSAMPTAMSANLTRWTVIQNALMVSVESIARPRHVNTPASQTANAKTEPANANKHSMMSQVAALVDIRVKNAPNGVANMNARTAFAMRANASVMRSTLAMTALSK